MKILVTGCTGYIGHLLCKYFEKNYEVSGTSSNCQPDNRNYKCDLRYPGDVRNLAELVRPELVIHAAGIKDISFCESHMKEAFEINYLTTANIVRTFGANSRIIYISTDYVFDGVRGNYNEEEVPSPGTVYGKSKLAAEKVGLELGEEMFTVVRTSAIYENHSKFIRFLSNSLAGGMTVNCYIDVIYSPTFFLDFCNILEKIINTQCKHGIYHGCGYRVSRYEFALLFASAFGYDISLVKPALRPSKDSFLFPDLSLSMEATQSIIGYYPTAHDLALSWIARQDAT